MENKINLKIMSKVYFLVILSGFLFAGLQDIDNKLNDTAVNTNTSSSGGNNYSEDGHYNNEVKIIGSANQFDRKKFGAQEFNDWLDLLALSRALETYDTLIKERRISRQGLVFDDSIQIGKELQVNRDDILKINSIATEYAKDFRVNDLLQVLKNNQVLDTEGYIYGSEKYAINLDLQNFNGLEEKIKSITWNINDIKVSQLLSAELYKIILNESTTIVVNKLETSTYQSKKAGFFESLLDGMVGNFVGKIVNPDKITTTRSKGAWSSDFNPYEYYRVYYRFLDYPYQYNNQGLVGIFGKKQLNSVTAFYEDKNNIMHKALNVSTRFSGDALNISMVPYGKLAFQYDEFVDSSDNIGFYNVTAGGGTYSPFIMVDFNVGLVYRRGINTNGVGFSAEMSTEVYPFNPVYFSLLFKQYAQPNFEAQKNTWDYSEIKAGVGANIYNLTVEGGYQFSKVLNGWYGQAQVYF